MGCVVNKDFGKTEASEALCIGSSACRRTGDRRNQKLRSALYALFRYRRKADRRSTHVNTAYYVDLHETPTLVLVLATMLLCVADAYFTLALLSAGGVELNPIMDMAIKVDALFFFTLKYAMTAFCILLLLWHKRFRVFRYFTGERILVMVFSLYIVLFNYELYLLAQTRAIPIVF